MQQPTWLDKVIEPVIDKGLSAIAQAIAASPEFLAAIQRGLDKPTPKHDAEGPSRAQNIRAEITAALQGKNSP